METCNGCGVELDWLDCEQLCWDCYHMRYSVHPCWRHSVESAGLLPRGSGSAYQMVYLLTRIDARGSLPTVYYSERDARSSSRALVAVRA